MMPKFTVVVPCYNEAARLDCEAFCRFAETHPQARLLFVNDGSTDATLEMLRDCAERGHGRIDVLDLPQNGGKAEAVRRGMLHAWNAGSDYLGFLDADLATPLNAIPQFCDILNRHDDCQLVIGIRMPLLGRAIQRRYLRQMLGKVFCRAASWVLGLGISDTQCGAKLFRATPECRRAFESPFHSRWIFDVEVMTRLIRTWRAGGRLDPAKGIFEFPLEEWREVRGSKLRPTDFLRAFLELIAIAWKAPPAPSEPIPSTTAPIEDDAPSRRRAA